MRLILFAAAAAAGGLWAPAAAGGVAVPFRYNWWFHYGPGPDDMPGPGTCSFPTDVSGSDCTNLEHNPNRFTPDDCMIGCCYEPTCLVWQQSGRACLWGGADAVCTGGKNSSGVFGGQRKAFQPVKTDYAFASDGVDDKGPGWQAVDIPHDSVLNGTFADNGDDHHGYLPRNVSWYRKRFTLPDDGKVWMLEFEGTFHYTQIFVNGKHVMDHSLGYTAYSLRLDNLTMIKKGSENLISIRTDASYGSGHWYEGGGLRWDINLVKYNQTHIVRHGAYVVPQVDSPNPAAGIQSMVEIAQEESMGDDANVAASFVLTSEAGVQVASCNTNGIFAAATTRNKRAQTVLRCSMKPNSPLSLWSIQHPTLYRVTVTVQVGGVVVDEQTWNTGFRTASFSGSTGVSLNGKGFKFRGFSHHDSFAGVGTAMPPRLDLFRAQAGRAVGNNVWRMSHNPYHPPLYDILDAIGTTVWDENRDLGPWYVSGMGEMVRRDRNHPSILLWSFCNEFECGQNSPSTGYMFRNATRAQDTSRPTASNVNGDLITGVDVQGFSHASSQKITTFHNGAPQIPTVLSECCSCTSHRLPVSQRGPTTSCIRAQNSPGLLPFDTGSLGVWTLFDYFGESHEWPNYACAFGQFDIAGSPKPHAYWYVVNWLQLIPSSDPGRPNIPKVDVARVLALADQPDCNAKKDGVSCTISGISTAANSELFVNGVSQGLQSPDVAGDAVSWEVPAPKVNSNFGTTSCNFSVNVSGVQCKQLTRCDARSADSCKSNCCSDPTCNVWQFDSEAGCWTSSTYNPSKCGPSNKPGTHWIGGANPSPPPPVIKFANLTMIGRDASGAEVARHTLAASDSGVTAKLVGITEVPSLATGTGSALVLDGQDSGLVAIKAVDSDGILLSTDSAAVNVTFSIESGPGRIIGVGSGNPADHAYQRGTVVRTYAGTAKAIVQVNIDCTSPARDDAIAIDSDPHHRTTLIPSASSCHQYTQQTIIVKATAGSMTTTVNIAVSDQVSKDGYLAVARATAGNLTGYTYMTDFVG